MSFEIQDLTQGLNFWNVCSYTFVSMVMNIFTLIYLVFSKCGFYQMGYKGRMVGYQENIYLQQKQSSQHFQMHISEATNLNPCLTSISDLICPLKVRTDVQVDV